VIAVEQDLELAERGEILVDRGDPAPGDPARQHVVSSCPASA